MPYISQLTFDVPQAQRPQLRIGDSIQVALSYLRALLPSEPGFVSARAMYSLTPGDMTHVVFESTWEDWDTFWRHHSKSILDEHRLLNEFKLEIEPQNVATHVYEEVD